MGWKHTVMGAAVSLCILNTNVGCAPDLEPGSGDDSSDDLVSPSNPQALSSVLVIPGATRVTGQPPTASSGSDAGDTPPMISGGSSLTVTSGNQAVLELNYQSSSGYRDCLVQVRGANEYFRVPVGNAATSGQIRIPIQVPSSVNAGSFSFYSCITNQNGAVSNPVSTSVGVSRPASTPTPSPTPTSPTPSTSGATCSPVSSVNGCSLQFCLKQNASACWYTANGRTFNCGSCTGSTSIQSCATEAANYLSSSCR
jgi:hypothetical protein